MKNFTKQKIKSTIEDSFEIVIPVGLMLLIIAIIALFITGVCVTLNRAAYKNDEDNAFSFSVVYQQTNNHDTLTIYKDNNTGIYYIANQGGIAPLLEKDGTIKIDKKEE